MKVLPTAIPDVLIFEPAVLRDERGLFLEMYNRAHREAGLPDFVQDNLSRSWRGTLRGLHFQNPNAQGKLVTVLAGAVLDVAVDVRRGSPTFGRHVAVELNADNRRQMWVPRGFAHGFCVLTESADFFYKCDAYYSRADEHVVRWDDPALAIAWPLAEPMLSPRDRDAPLLADVAQLPIYDPACASL
ncbi:MAG: dTDP-4-dehydrorhamnose 3,5-epimerase [Pseudorhodoplanes sp.]|nr:dTDP-4-dehydrorhamnose 3,5-epimerase [Pseudorhodoplanes sp.]